MENGGGSFPLGDICQCLEIFLIVMSGEAATDI